MTLTNAVKKYRSKIDFLYVTKRVQGPNVGETRILLSASVSSNFFFCHNVFKGRVLNRRRKAIREKGKLNIRITVGEYTDLFCIVFLLYKKKYI